MPEEDKYDVLEKIGHGSFGIIRKVKRKTDGYILCRKEISYSKMSSKEKEQLQAELSILKELRHPNIVAYFEREHIKASCDLHLYMEYCGNGDLGRLIKNLKLKNQYAEEEFVWSIFSQTVGALYRCHYGEDPPKPSRDVMGLGNNARPRGRTDKPMILHRDLKPENIFLGTDNSVKLGDFGLSKILQSHDFASTYVGTPFYMSPEICSAEQYTLYSDIWALGCILYELCTREPPFNAKTHFELIQKIKAGRYPPLPSCYSSELSKVINTCLQVNPSRRPDTAQLLNLPIVKLMRKEQEVVILGKELKDQRDEYARKNQQLTEKLAQMEAQMAAQKEAMRKEMDSTLRREWEVKARLEIDRQVSLGLADLQRKFESEVLKEVNRRLEELAKQNATRSSSPEFPPRSSTPTMTAAQQTTLFPSDPAEPSHDSAPSRSTTSTLGTASDFPSSTDLSSLSLDSPVEEQPKPAATKKTRRPLARAQTMFTGQAVSAPAPASPMDVQMADPSPMTIASLSLSPRKTQPRSGNIFAAKSNERWEPEFPPSPTEEEWAGDLDEDDDDLPALPSPTRPRSTSGNRKAMTENPFKALGAAQRPLLKPTQRLASVPNLTAATNGNPGAKVRPHSAVPVIATSPTRQRSKQEAVSPIRKTLTTKDTTTTTTSSSSGFKSKKGNEQMRIQAMRNNQLQGRTLVELQQARGIPVHQGAVSEDEGRKAVVRGILRSPVKRGSASEEPPAFWDPETDEMPSPFLVRTRKVVR